MISIYANHQCLDLVNKVITVCRRRNQDYTIRFIDQQKLTPQEVKSILTLNPNGIAGVVKTSVYCSKSRENLTVNKMIDYLCRRPDQLILPIKIHRDLEMLSTRAQICRELREEKNGINS